MAKRTVNWFYENRSEHNLRMEDLYDLIQISRQGFHAYREKGKKKELRFDSIINRVQALRENHPKMGARPLYIMMMNNASDQELLHNTGMNKFEALLLTRGFGVQKIRNYRRTTFGGGFRFDNLILGLRIKELNHVWVSDITYFYCWETQKFFYLTSIIDVYSRKCLGLSWSKTLKTEDTTIPALKMALKYRKIKKYEKLIFHSDGGGQYYDAEFIKLLRKWNITSSMGKSAYENPFAEKFNDILKNYYLIPWSTAGKNLNKGIIRFLKSYNEEKPHGNLNNLTPSAFEDAIEDLALHQRGELLLKNPRS